MTTPSSTRGVVFIHSTPAALCPHISWALESVLGQRVSLEWTAQPLGRKLVRAEFSWLGPAGTGARLASALRGWDDVRYEVTESRWQHTPTLGIHHTWISAVGDAVINEDRLRDVLADAEGDAAAVLAAIDDLLGAAWDQELEPFRHAGDGTSVRWLHKVG